MIEIAEGESKEIPMTRVQVLLDEDEKQKFERHARREGLSLSAWLREAGTTRLKNQSTARKIVNPADLRAFFAACDAEESGREPDWEEHLATLEHSKMHGATGE